MCEREGVCVVGGGGGGAIQRVTVRHMEIKTFRDFMDEQKLWTTE